MNRRAFLYGTVATALATPLEGQAKQPERVYRVGLIFVASPVSEMAGADPINPAARAFIHELRALGYVEGQNLILERRSAEGKSERFRAIVQDLVEINTDVIVTPTNATAHAAKALTRTVPIVMATSLNPVEEGLVTSLGRPGANVTGLTLDAGSGIVAKHLELLKEVLPRLSRVVLLQDKDDAHPPAVQQAQAAGRAMGVTLLVAEHTAQYETAFGMVVRERPDGLLVGYSGKSYANRQLIVDFAAKSELPLVTPYREFVVAGGLMAYGASVTENFRRAATYVDRILKGANPAEMPVELPQTFELVINLKTAKALGLTIPPSLLLRADKVIE